MVFLSYRIPELKFSYCPTILFTIHAIILLDNSLKTRGEGELRSHSIINYLTKPYSYKSHMFHTYKAAPHLSVLELMAIG